MTDQRGRARNRRRTSAEIRADIAETRARLAEDIDAAKAKFSRRGLQHEAMGALRNLRHEGSDVISGVSDSADNQVSELGRMTVDTIKRYPVVTTLVGLGLAMLAFTNGRRMRSASRVYEPQEQLPPADMPATAELPPTRY